jgi:DNA-binding transcriptional MerR regulator
MSYKEDTIERLYFDIGSVAKSLGVETSCIRFWEVQFEIEPRMNRIGHRRYNATQIGQLALIARLVKYFHIQAAKEILENGQAERILDILEPSVGEPVGVPLKIIA